MRERNRTAGRNKPFQNHFRLHQKKRLQTHWQSSSRNASRPQLEMHPHTGYGTAAAMDEVVPIFDSNILEKVSMRGGGPYDFLDEDDDDEDDLTSMKSGINQKLAKFKSDEDDDDTPYAQDDYKSIISGTSRASTLKLTRQSDTISHNKNDYSWGTETASSSGVSSLHASTVDTYYKEKWMHSGKNYRSNNGINNVAAGLIPLAPKEDIYAQAPTGFLFAKNKPDSLPPPPTWTTMDLTTSKINYEDGARKPTQTRKYSWNPEHKSNTPLAATFGTPNVVHAPETALTAERLEQLDQHHQQRRTAQSLADYCEVAIPSSPNIPPSEPSVILSSAADSFDTRSVQSSLFVGDDRLMAEHSRDIDQDVKANFMTDINAMHDVRPALTDFDKRNKDVMVTNIGHVTYVNDFGDGKIQEFTPKYEDRTRFMDENMQYIGPNRGEVKKRYIRWFLEMLERRDREMTAASKEYREWKAMSPEARMERLREIRQPIQLWNGKPGAADDNLYSVEDIPKFYKKQQTKKILKEKQKSGAIPAADAQSTRSERTVDTRDTIGRLGDCDEVQTNTTAGSRTPHRSDYEVQQLLVQALDDRHSRGRRVARSQSARDISPSHSVVSASSTTAQTDFVLSNNILAGTGNSVAGPRPTLAKAPSGPRSVQSQSPWSSMRAPSSVAGSSNAARSISGGSNSTVKASRNAPQGSTKFSTASVASHGTNIHRDFNRLMIFDDSPLLQEPDDINIAPPALQGDELIQYNLAVENAMKRGRVVTVRLHTLPDGMPKFTPGAIANRVFGGSVQEFQLHPDKRTAVVVFLHPVEARAFVHHFQNVRNKGTEQEIRELQVEVSWYKGSEAESILPPQPNLLKYHLGLSATRCIQIHRIPLGKTHRQLFDELGQRLNKLLLCMYLIAPQQHYLQVSCGRHALIEFRSLSDAIEAYKDFTSGMIQEYEDAEPEFVNEGTARQGKEKPYCGCLGCEERRRHKELVEERKRRALEAQFKEASTKASERSESAMDVDMEEDLIDFSDSD